MSDAGFDETDPALLSELLRMDETAGDLWRPDDLGSVLRHQLTVPIREVMAGLDMKPDRERGGLAIGELLAISGSLDELELLKKFAKMNSACGEALFPEPVAMILYFSSIIAARARFGARLSSLDDQELRDGLNWCFQQEWLDEQLRAFLENARKHLETGVGKPFET